MFLYLEMVIQTDMLIQVDMVIENDMKVQVDMVIRQYDVRLTQYFVVKKIVKVKGNITQVIQTDMLMQVDMVIKTWSFSPILLFGRKLD